MTRLTRRWSARSQGRNRARILGLIGAVTLFGCMTAPKPPASVTPRLTLTATHFAELSEWANSDFRAGLDAFRRSCSEIQEKAADSPLGGVGYAGTIADWGAACRQA